MINLLKKLVIFSFLFGIFCLFLPDVSLAAISIDDLPDNYFEGWAWSGNALDDQSHIGFISLCDQVDGLCEDSNYKLSINKAGILEDRYVPLDGYLWFGEYDNADISVDKYNVGWMDFSVEDLPPARLAENECGYPTAPGDYRAFYDLEDDNLVGWARILSLKQEGESHGFDDWGWVSLCGKDEGAFKYRITYDQLFQRLRGWSWSGGGSTGGVSPGYSNDVGFGWLEFNPQITLATYYYLQTFYGDVYSTEDVIGERPNAYGDWGATYLILAGGQIVDFSSARGGVTECAPDCEEGFECDQGYCVQEGTTLDNWMIEDYTQIYLPSEDRGYYNVLGELDVEELIDYEPVTNKNKYGHVVDDSLSAMDYIKDGGNISLEGKIIYVDGDLTLDGSDITFLNTVGGQGDGTIVVNGNVQIDVNINNQDSSGLNYTRELASAAWIVLGDLRVNSEVENLAGAFFVFGSDDALGVFDTGVSDKSLTVKGLIMAHSFNFDRASDFGASESVIYDGRVVVNPSPGLEDFSAVLPHIVE